VGSALSIKILGIQRATHGEWQLNLASMTDEEWAQFNGPTSEVYEATEL